MALTNVKLITYNNYYNHIRKIPDPADTVDSYVSKTYTVTQTNVNFYKGDGIDTEIVINTAVQGLSAVADFNALDYLIEYDNDNYPLSHWFILEATQTRTGQTKFKLKRDILVDFRGKYENAPALIKRGTVKSTQDYAIYNQEEIKYNVIKTSEALIKDNSGCAWIVGYSSNKPVETTSVTDGYRAPNGLTINGKIPANAEAIEYINDWNEFSLWDYCSTYNTNYKSNAYVPFDGVQVLYEIGYYNQVSPTGYYYTKHTWNNNFIPSNYPASSTTPRYAYVESLNASYPSTIASIIKSYGRNKQLVNATIQRMRSGWIVSDNKIEPVKNYVFNRATGKYYKVEYSETTTNITGFESSIEGTKAYFDALNVRGDLDRLGVKYGNIPDPYSIYLDNTRVILRTIHLTQVTEESIQSEYRVLQAFKDNTGMSAPGITHSRAKVLADAPYTMFAIPIGGYIIGGSFYSLTRVQAMQIATDIATKLGSNCYDIQLLPFCPFAERFLISGALSTQAMAEHEDYTNIQVYESGNWRTTAHLFYCDKSSNEIVIDNPLPINETVEEFKVANQCDTYRLCSPNYAAMFEFNLAKTGAIEKFNIDITYKPYSPYVHISPVWGRLYGNDFDDTRGLILSGDFSLPMISDAWVQFQINNKNYQNSFNREVESVELNNKYAKLSDAISATVGTVQGGMTGAYAGSKLGGLPGAVAGGVGGALVSAGGGLADIFINDKLRNEQLDLKKDLFNYGIQNIQALPMTLSKIGSFDKNNKLFPILEYYTCTVEEKQDFIKYLKYNGMTVNRISTIEEYSGGYIKGNFIVLPNINDDYHTAMELANLFADGYYTEDIE